MGSFRTPQPLGAAPDTPTFALRAEYTAQVMPTETDGTPHGTYATSAPSPPPQLTAEEQDMILELAQLGLDLGGIFEPTPFCDLGSAGISAYRGAWGEVFISFGSMIPYLGDSLKVLKSGKYVRLLERVVRHVADNPAFARAVRPALESLSKALEQAPSGEIWDKLRHLMSDAVGTAGKAVDGLFPKAIMKVGDELAKKKLQLLWRQPKPNSVRQLPALKAHDPAVNMSRLRKTLDDPFAGFVRVKDGTSGSEVYMRRVPGDRVEMVRIDKPGRASGAKARRNYAKEYRDGVGTEFRRDHIVMETPTEAAQKFDDGLKAGEMDHVHIESFTATPENMAKALDEKAKLTGSIKHDFRIRPTNR